MADNQYNGRKAHLEGVASGTILYRILAANASYPSNSYNPTTRTLGDDTQGRFEPTDPSLGGYTYVSPTLAGAVAEGILRNQKISDKAISQRMWMVNKKIVTVRLMDDIQVAAVYGSHTAVLNLDGSLLCGDKTSYSGCRTVGTQILLNTPEARGLQYDCRNHLGSTSLTLIGRGGEPKLDIVAETEVLRDTGVLNTLHHVFHLPYTGS